MLAFAQGPVPRLVVVGLLLLALQQTIFSELRPASVAIQVLLAMAVAVGAVGGPERGALAGFVFGLIFDLGVGTPLGSSSASMGIGGYVAGYVTSVAADPHWWLLGLFIALGAAVGEGSAPLVRAVAGESGYFSPHFVVTLIVVVVASAVLSFVFVPLGRWCLKLKRPKWRVIPE